MGILWVVMELYPLPEKHRSTFLNGECQARLAQPGERYYRLYSATPTEVPDGEQQWSEAARAYWITEEEFQKTHVQAWNAAKLDSSLTLEQAFRMRFQVLPEWQLDLDRLALLTIPDSDRAPTIYEGVVELQGDQVRLNSDNVERFTIGSQVVIPEIELMEYLSKSGNIQVVSNPLAWPVKAHEPLSKDHRTYLQSEIEEALRRDEPIERAGFTSEDHPTDAEIETEMNRRLQAVQALSIDDTTKEDLSILVRHAATKAREQTHSLQLEH